MIFYFRVLSGKYILFASMKKDVDEKYIFILSDNNMKKNHKVKSKSLLSLRKYKCMKSQAITNISYGLLQQ